jgi:hypothetical protein
LQDHSTLSRIATAREEWFRFLVFMEDIDRKIARLVRRDGPDVPRLPVSSVMSLVQIMDLSPAE